MTAVLGRGLAERIRAAEEQAALRTGDEPLLVDLGEPVVAAPAPAVLDEPPAEPAAPAPPGRVRRLWILPAAVVVAGALALVPTVGDDGPGPGEAELRVEGTAEVAGRDGRVERVTDRSVRVGPGDTVEVVEGTVHFALADDVTFEGRAEPTVGGRAGTTVLMGTAPEVLAGDLLVVAPTAVELRAAGTAVSVGPSGRATGAARLERGLGLGLSTYRGRVDVDSAGRAAVVAPLHRIEVAAVGSLGRRDLPLAYSAADPWDRRFLGDAILVDRQLAPLLVGLEGAEADLHSVAGLRRALPGLPAPQLAEVVEAAASGPEALVAATLADVGEDGTFASRAAAALRFRDDGARWGLVALDGGVDPGLLLDEMRAAVDRYVSAGGLDPTSPSGEVADPTPDGTGPGSTTVPAGPGTTTEPGGATGGGTTVPPDGGAGGGGGGSTPTVPGAPTVPTVPTTPTIPPLPPIPPVGGGSVGGVVDGVGGTVGGVVEGVGGVVDGLLEGLGGGTTSGGTGSGGSGSSGGGLLGPLLGG